MPLKIHLIFKTHLDVGFTDYAAEVVKRYFDDYIPNAIRLARIMREQETADRFIWTTGSWLIYEYLEQAGHRQRLEMENAIQQGDLAWHALPFTTHSELMDAELFRLGLSLSQRLDARFGKQTIAAKFTDVPGHTRGIVPLLVEAGVKFLQVGVNGGSAVPRVPPLIRWQDPTGSQLIVMYEGSYGKTFILPGEEIALAFGHSMDNLGPQNEVEVSEIYRMLRQEHPEAAVFASTLNDFAEHILPLQASLPVVTQEIGDSWIHGVGSDPVKMSQFRELLRLRSEWLRNDPSLAENPRLDRFQRKLLLVPEHTWGMDEKTWLNDHEPYSASDFAAARSKPNFRAFEASWMEQRAYITEAVRELEGSPPANEARDRLAAIKPELPKFPWIGHPLIENQTIDSGWLTGLGDPYTGALTDLTYKPSKRELTDANHPLAWLRYQTFSEEDYERFFRQYIRPEEQNNGWSREDFTKPGIDKADPISRFWQLEATGFYGEGNECWFGLNLEGDSDANYGCPRVFYLHYVFSNDRPEIDIDLLWFEKRACRLPEAIWLSFKPPQQQGAKWFIEKLGQWVSPLDVVENGNRHLHACSRVHMESDDLMMTIESLDAPLVAPGQPSLLNFNNIQPDMTQGVHFNLYNNLWGTNFPMWLEDDCRFRFRLRFEVK